MKRRCCFPHRLCCCVFKAASATVPTVSGPQSPVSSSGSPRKGSNGSASEVAGAEEFDRAPRLLRLVKLDSNARAEVTDQVYN